MVRLDEYLYWNLQYPKGGYINMSTPLVYIQTKDMYRFS